MTGGLFANAIGLLGGQVSKVLVQGLYFVLLARLLGPEMFGLFSAVVALVAIVAPFSSAGTNILMVRAVARDSQKAAWAWARALFFTLVGGVLLALLLAALSPFWLPAASFAVVLAIALADLAGLKLTETAAALWQAKGKSRPLVYWPTLMNLGRLVAVAMAVLWFGDTSDLLLWSILYLAASVPLGLVLAYFTSKRLGDFSGSLGTEWREIRLGLSFSMSSASQTIYNDIDKTMLARLASATDAGIYSAAYRIVDMAYTPIRALAAATYPVYFQEGTRGIRASLALTRRVAPVTVGYAILAGVGLVFLAPLVPLILGPAYESVVDVLPLVAWIILARGLAYLAADALSGADQVGIRTTAQVVVAVASVGLNAILIPSFGLYGAIGSALICQVALVIALWAAVYWVLARSKGDEFR